MLKRLSEGERAPLPKVSKQQALKEVGALLEAINVAEQEEVTNSRSEVLKLMRELLDSPELLQSLRKEEFLRTGLGLIDLASCPFCAVEWDITTLRANVTARIDQAKRARGLRDKIDAKGRVLFQTLNDLATLANATVTLATQLSANVEAEHVRRWVSELLTRKGMPKELGHLAEAADDYAREYRQADESVISSIRKVHELTRSLPDASKEDDARDYLTRGQERLEMYREQRRLQVRNAVQSAIADAANKQYMASCASVLGAVYERVSDDFGEFYRFIHGKDEEKFKAKLEPVLGKLSFDVDFYQRGLFPPQAYHSEGHQDSMGVCLYLALMRHTMSTKFTFSILDDVLMSVDAGQEHPWG